MDSLFIIFPDQINKNNLVLQKINKGERLLCYEPLETFYDLNHHKQKLVFLISSFRKFILNIDHANIIHIKINKTKVDLINIVEKINLEKKIKNIYITKPSDYKTQKDLMFFCQSKNVNLNILEDKKFISSAEDYKDWSEGKKVTIQEYYYRYLRKKYDIFMDSKNKPIGDKWNFDKENRVGASKLKDIVPKRKSIKVCKLTFSVMVDVEECFPNSSGDLENFNWATTHEEAESLLDDFIERYFRNYGSFQDAINKENTFMFHSLLSPYLNSGLLDPLVCIDKAIEAYGTKDIPINSVEGFIRQIIGWREFIRGVYWENMPRYKSLNYWGHKNKLNSNWYDGATGIPPLDDAINESVNYGYTHHINRLMVISNLMNLTGIHPDEIYRWFMEMYIDSYDWVMVPNVYGMGTFSDGGIFSTKPYICGSSYLLRMSNYKKDQWCDVVDGLYWQFIERNIKFFESNPRLSLMSRSLKKMDNERKKKIFKSAKTFIEKNTL